MPTRSRFDPLLRLAVLSAVGFFMSSASAATFVYVGNADSQDVTVLQLQSTRRPDGGRNHGGAGPGQARRVDADGGSVPTRSGSLSACATSRSR